MKAFVFLASVFAAATASAQIVYKCEKPNGSAEYANGPSVPPGCKKVDIESTSVVTIPAPKSGSGKSGEGAARGGAGNFPKVDAETQRARDNDRRRLLETELQTQQERLDALRREYNNGEPERRGDERNYQKYLDRVNQMRDEIARTEANIASVKRELSQLRD